VLCARHVLTGLLLLAAIAIGLHAHVRAASRLQQLHRTSAAEARALFSLKNFTKFFKFFVTSNL